jgi:hypothetical protein
LQYAVIKAVWSSEEKAKHMKQSQPKLVKARVTSELLELSLYSAAQSLEQLAR